jgi:hypothetical protein
MAKKKDGGRGSSLFRASTRFLFPYDARRSSQHTNTHGAGDKRTRTYRNSGKEREIVGAELRKNRSRDSNWTRHSGDR